MADIIPPVSTPKREIAKPKAGRRSHLGSVVLVVGILAVLGLFAWAEVQRRHAVRQLASTQQQLEEIKKSTSRSGAEVAKAVLDKVRKHIDVPSDPAPTVATIVDVDRLRQTSDFYKKAKNGDNLIITENRAILYDPDKDIVIDVVPVQINRTSPTPAPSGAAQVKSSVTPSPEASATPLR